jgi:hypothetical protein
MCATPETSWVQISFCRNTGLSAFGGQVISLKPGKCNQATRHAVPSGRKRHRCWHVAKLGVSLGNTWAILAMLFGDPWIFMCEGSRVKMGYVTCGVGGEKHTKTNVRLKKTRRNIHGEKDRRWRQRKSIREKTYQKRQRESMCVSVCVLCFTIWLCVL